MKKLKHLSEIYMSYDTFVIDLWGVMHDGVKLYKEAIEAVENLTKKNKRIVFLSNAPRPSLNIVNFLREIKMDEKFFKNVLTSGEAAFRSINNNTFGKKFYHLGPKKDEPLYADIKENKTSLENCDFILCTGLFTDQMKNLEFYSNLLKSYKSKKFVCTNPDLTVHKGDREEFCAGSVAVEFEKIGGKVIYFGKPYEEIYKICLRKNEKNLIIGDNLRTDIKGANNLKLDSIFISEGVHRSEFKNENDLSLLLKKYKVEANYFQPKLSW